MILLIFNLLRLNGSGACVVVGNQITAILSLSVAVLGLFRGDVIMINIVLCDDNIEFCKKLTKQLTIKIRFDKEIYVYNMYDENFKDYIEKIIPIRFLF